MSKSTSRGREPAITHTRAPLARYRSLSTKSSISCGETFGPRSLISVCSPVVGSITAVLVRDSSPMRTKSLSTFICVSWSTIRVPVAPPASPVAITGAPSRLSTRATLTPLPPGIVVCSTVRWRRPSRKFGTDSVLSMAVLSVTVMIMRLAPPRRGCGGAGGGRGAQRRGQHPLPRHDGEGEDDRQRPGEPGLGLLRQPGGGDGGGRD